MEQTECSETLAYKIQNPGNYPEESIQLSERGVSLKSRINANNSSVHKINTRSKHHFHRPVANLSCFQKGTSYSGIKIFNSLPTSITSLKNEKTQFRIALKKFLYANSFYCMDEFSACTGNMYC
jgi:hypothetical protein